MKISERVAWILLSLSLLIVCTALWVLPKMGSSKEGSHVRLVAERVLEYAREHDENLPNTLADLTFDYLELAEKDRMLIWGIAGNLEVSTDVQMHPTLLRYAIVKSDKRAIIHTVPDSNAHGWMVWQKLEKSPEGWTHSGFPKWGTFSEMANEVMHLKNSRSEQGADFNT